MLEILEEHFILCFLNVLLAIYLQSKILQVKINYKKVNFYFSLIILVLINIVNYIYIDGFLRFILSTIIFIPFSFCIFEKNKAKIFFSVIIQQLIYFISEVIYILIVFITPKQILYLTNSTNSDIVTNLVILLIATIIYKLKFIFNKFIKLSSHLDKINDSKKYFISIFFVVTANVLLMTIYSNYKNILVMIINVFFTIVYSIILYCLVIEKNKNSFYIKENKILIDNLNEYEKMLDYQRVNNHENKNQLLVIKSMIEKKDKKLMEYINEIIKEKREDDEIVYNKAKRIPSGGLQGLIYQKMLLMQEKNIEVNLDINSKVRKIDFGNLSSKMNYDICRIVGIIIDNAIEEVLKFNKKEREIIISMYIDDMFIIEVSNRIKADIDLSKIYEKGYTNKENGHGYGLSLLKKIVDENDNIINEVKIVNNIFTQVIKIKM